MSIEIKFTDHFKKDVRQLAKKYRRIRLDIQPIIDRLQSGELLGDRLQQTDQIFYKVRVKNSDIQKGKSGGYRLIYHVRDTEIIIMMTIYSKSQQEDISSKKIQEILAEFQE